MDKRQLMKYLYAFVCGDGGVYMQKAGKTAYLRVSHKIENDDYLQFKKGILEDLTFVGEYVRDLNGKQYKTLTTRSHPVYTKIWERMYLDGKKVLDPHVFALLDWEFLAILYQDDGTLLEKSRSIRLALCRFSSLELSCLAKELYKLFDLHFSVIRSLNYYSLRLRTKSFDTFVAGVKSFIAPSMQYKLPESERSTPIILGEDIVRTTQQCVA